MALEIWETYRLVVLIVLLILMLRVNYRLKSVEANMAQEAQQRSTMVDAVTRAALEVAEKTSVIASRLAIDTQHAANQAAEESALRHQLLGADLAKVLKSNQELAEQLAKKIEKPILAETIQDATQELAAVLGEKIDVGVEKAEASYQAANHANEKILELTKLVAGQQAGGTPAASPAAPNSLTVSGGLPEMVEAAKVIAGAAPQLDSIEKTGKATHVIVSSAAKKKSR